MYSLYRGITNSCQITAVYCIVEANCKSSLFCIDINTVHINQNIFIYIQHVFSCLQQITSDPTLWVHCCSRYFLEKMHFHVSASRLWLGFGGFSKGISSYQGHSNGPHESHDDFQIFSSSIFSSVVLDHLQDWLLRKYRCAPFFSFPGSKWWESFSCKHVI